MHIVLYIGFVGITIAYVFHDFIWGEKLFLYTDIGSDTMQQYYPYYMNCVRRISEGSFSIWNWDYGLGTSLINNISQTLDPFGLFVILGGVVFRNRKSKTTFSSCTDIENYSLGIVVPVLLKTLSCK